MMDFTERLSRPLCLKIFSYVSFREKVRLEVVAKKWRQIALDSYRSDQRGSVWLYVIFRKNRISGHDGLSVKFSYDGPIFWQRLVAYVYTCCCHFQQPRNELTFKSLCDKLSANIDRVCMVDTPINFPFLSDSLVRHLLDSLPHLQWIYLRELDLENVTVQTVTKLAQHPALKKVILHFCRNVDSFSNFSSLPQLLIVNSQIQGLKYFEEVEKHLSESPCEEPLLRSCELVEQQLNKLSLQYQQNHT